MKRVVELLLTGNIDIGDFKGTTPLMFAVKANEKTLVESLIDAGADVNHTDEQGQTALIHAVESQNEELIKILLEAGADTYFVTDAKETAKIRAKKLGGRKIIELLENKRTIFYPGNVVIAESGCLVAVTNENGEDANSFLGIAIEGDRFIKAGAQTELIKAKFKQSDILNEVN